MGIWNYYFGGTSGGISPAGPSPLTLSGIRNSTANGMLTFNMFGDSISAIGNQSTQPNDPLALVPQRQNLTVYAVGNIVKDGSGFGVVYRCTTPGTSGSVSIAGNYAVTVTDGSVGWTTLLPSVQATSSSYGCWADIWSGGKLALDLTAGYQGTFQGIIKVMVVNGGTGYSLGTTITLGSGASGNVTVGDGGVITGVVITNPGYGTVTAYTLNNVGSGSGAILRVIFGGNGTFGSYGDTTDGMLARVQDACNSNVGLIGVGGGTNDVTNTAGITAATIFNNLVGCCEAIVASNKYVVIRTITPRTGLTFAQSAMIIDVNQRIRAYANGNSSVNPRGIRVGLCDSVSVAIDPIQKDFSPIGGAGNAWPNTTYDGLHPNQYLAMMDGYNFYEAARAITGTRAPFADTAFSWADAYDATANPNGNALEALQLTVGTVVAIGQTISNGNNIYECTAGGTILTLPTGTTTFTDGNGVAWTYTRPSGISVGGQTTGGFMTATPLIQYNSGSVGVSSTSIGAGLNLTRGNGSSGGTITTAYATPANGRAGRQLNIGYSISAGLANEQWTLTIFNGALDIYGITAGGYWSFIVDVEMNSAAQMNMLGIELFGKVGGNNVWTAWAGAVASNAGSRLLQPGSTLVPYPANNRLIFKTPKIYIPPGTTAINGGFKYGFDTVAGTATAAMSINNFALKPVM